MYAQPLKERCIISINSPFRFLKDGNWRKGIDDTEMYSSESGAFVGFKSDRDISVSTTRFAPIRILIVVKDKIGDDEQFFEKLLM